MPTFRGQVVDSQIIFSVTVATNDLAKRRSYRALLDTGAQGTMISSKVIEEIGLKPVGSLHIVPVSGEPLPADMFQIRLDVPIAVPFTGPHGDLDVERTLRGISDLEVGRLPYDPGDYDVLLGMDFLQSGLHLTIYQDLFIISS